MLKVRIAKMDPTRASGIIFLALLSFSGWAGNNSSSSSSHTSLNCPAQEVLKALVSAKSLTPLQDAAWTPTWDWANHQAGSFEITPLDENFSAALNQTGTAIVTLGGSSITAYIPSIKSTAKVYYSRLPKSAAKGGLAELADWVAQAAEPALANMVRHGQISRSTTPTLIIPAPGFVTQEHQWIRLPENLGDIGGKSAPLAKEIQKALAARADQIGISKELLLATRIHLENDSLPIVATAAYTRLEAGQSATVIFVGTGTGCAKVAMVGENRFTMSTAEESFTPMGKFPASQGKKGIEAGVPFHILMGARIARSAHGSFAPVSEVTLENVSAGGRIMEEGNRIHLGGANSVALSYLLDEVGVKPSEMPIDWIRERLPKDWEQYRLRMRESLGLKPDQKLSAEDRKMLLRLKDEKSLSTKEINDFANQGSELAQHIVRDNTFSQGYVATILGFNAGESPMKTPIDASVMFGKNPKPNMPLNIIVRATGGMGNWANDQGFSEAQAGSKLAQKILGQNPAYLNAIHAQGLFFNPSEIIVNFIRDEPNPNLHPDFGRLDRFAKQLREEP